MTDSVDLTREEWAAKLVARFTTSTLAVPAVATWTVAEGGAGPQWGTDNVASYNPLNTSWRTSTSRTVNADGVQAYASWQEGLDATAATLGIDVAEGAPTGYPAIRTAIEAGAGCADLATAVAVSRWGTGDFSHLCPAILIDQPEPAPAPQPTTLGALIAMATLSLVDAQCYVRYLYRVTFHREVDPLGFAVWPVELANGTKSPDDVLAALNDSTEGQACIAAERKALGLT